MHACPVIQSCLTLCDLWTVVRQAPLSMGFSRQEYWSELPFPSSRGSSWPRDRTSFSSDSCLGRQILLPLSHLGNPWKHLLLFSHWVMSNSLPPHGLQHARLPCPSLSPGVCSNSCPLSKWCHPTILCYPLLLPSIFPNIRVFSNESALHIRWPKYWNFSISPSNEYSGLSSFRSDWFDLLAVQGILKSLLQHHSLKALILRLSAFFIVQLSHPYMTTGKTIALTRRTFAGKVMSMLFNTLSRFVIAFLPRSNHLLISWIQSLSTVILEPKKIKSVTVSTFPLFAMKWWDWMPWSLFFECWVLS